MVSLGIVSTGIVLQGIVSLEIVSPLASLSGVINWLSNYTLSLSPIVTVIAPPPDVSLLV